MPWTKLSPAICSCPTSGLSPTISGAPALDEGQRVADGGQQDVAARLVGLGLDARTGGRSPGRARTGRAGPGPPCSGPGRPDVLGGVGLGALAPAPEHVGVRAQLGRQVEVAHDLAERVAAHVAVVGGERAVRNTGWVKVLVVPSAHQPGRLQGLAERLMWRSRWSPSDPNGTRSSSWKVTPQAPSSARRWTASTGSRAAGWRRRTGPGRPADGPQAEAELVLTGRAGLVHGSLLTRRTTAARWSQEPGRFV
jgi:hypothetical protein